MLKFWLIGICFFRYSFKIAGEGAPVNILGDFCGRKLVDEDFFEAGRRAAVILCLLLYASDRKAPSMAPELFFSFTRAQGFFISGPTVIIWLADLHFSFLLFIFCNKPCECAFKGDVLPFVHDLNHDVHKGPSLFREFFLSLHGFLCVNKAC